MHNRKEQITDQMLELNQDLKHFPNLVSYNSTHCKETDYSLRVSSLYTYVFLYILPSI